jgi:hypothetical protein
METHFWPFSLTAMWTLRRASILCYLDTGLFLDQRITRAWLRRMQ